MQYHVAGRVANGCVQVRNGIVDQPQGFVVCFFCALGLGCSNGTKGDKHGDVDGNHIVEESSENMLDKVDGLWRKRRGVVEIFHVLDFGAIDGMRPGVGGILLAFGVWMLELVQCLFNVAWYGDIDIPVGVIPHKVEAVEKRSRPLDRDGVQYAECGDEMVCGRVAGVLDAKIVDDQREHNGKVGMCLERRCAGDQGIAVLREIQSEAVVGNDAILLEAGHAFLDFEVDPAVKNKCRKVVLCDDLVRDGVEGHTHVLVEVHERIII